jgi:hypothetical protein
MLTKLQLVFVYSYGLPLFIINLRTVYVLWAKKAQFSSSYYRLFFLSGLNDIFLYLANNLFLRLCNYTPLFDAFFSKMDEYQRWPAIGMFLIMFCSHFSHFAMFLLCFNRLTAILMFMTYEKVSSFICFCYI